MGSRLRWGLIVAAMVICISGMVALAGYLLVGYTEGCEKRNFEDVQMAQREVLPYLKGLPVRSVGSVSQCDSFSAGYVVIEVAPSVSPEAVAAKFHAGPWKAVPNQRLECIFVRKYRDGDLYATISTIDLLPPDNAIPISVSFVAP